jgi:hypothetical protein
MKYAIWFYIFISTQGYGSVIVDIPRYSFDTIWSIISKTPYTTLPQTEVSYQKLTDGERNIILSDAKRTLESHADILPSFEKLVHPNGICFRGFWEITESNPYSGYFKQGSKALIIARASSALSRTSSGGIRSFGFAGKIFASLDGSEISPLPTANFFLIDDLGGTDARYYSDVTLTNAPPLSYNGEILKHLYFGLKVNSAFKKADQNPKIRQLYEISYLNITPKSRVITPKWMKIKARKRVSNSTDRLDFRDELKLEGTERLIFDISVASREDRGEKLWQKIGSITLDSSVSSRECDSRLHFHHPRWRDDLR